MPSPPKSPSIGIRYISDAVKSDHRLLERLYTSLAAPSSTSSPDSQRALCSRFAWELARHLVTMELFIFPGTAHRAKQGNQAAQHRQRDMAQLRQALRSFSAVAAASNPGYEKLNKVFKELSGPLIQHIRDIERVELVNIEKVLSAQESEDLARDFERSVFFIPHGVRDEEEEDASVKAPYKTVGGLLDAGAEELRAAMEKFPRE
ncbi:hhe domain protein [Diaporthe amygdali]|uniref:hhe domain protein n=1 Tax=Phomopsis amygdali TaxID=1214568 RepID=UPI0022FF15BE|nr:hhe domain protein [Diaporthe amygdali]KAJ0115107.1 hhe domain protein [Diaporthe amygdali]